MMLELRDRDLARSYLVQGLWLRRLAAPTPTTVRPALEWALELAGGGQPLLPIGVLADLGQLALAAEPALHPEKEAITGWPAGLAREYEDLVLGKLLADSSFERGADALRRYQGRDRARGLAFLVNQFRERAGFGGALLSPAIIRGLIDSPPEGVLAEGWESLNRDGLLPELADLYREIIAAARRTGEVLAAEDIFELEQGTALLELGQRLALRQVLQAAARLEADLPQQRLRPPASRRDVPTHILDEDIYPVGGYSSVSNRGTIESLLPSQLAYMEKTKDIDLFDVKYVRDELLYYSRDENQFLRRRRTFVIALFSDLVQARHKDVELPWQRIVLLLGLLVAAVRKLTEWLSADALVFDFCFIGKDEALAHERHLLELIFRTALANGTVRITRLPDDDALTAHCSRLGRISICHCLWIATELQAPARLENASLASLAIEEARPVLQVDGENREPERTEHPEHLESWSQALRQLLAAWS